jgi:hypothetical protein
MGGCPGHLAKFTLNSVSDIFIVTFRFGEPAEVTLYFNAEELGMIKDFIERLTIEDHIC